MAIAGLIFLVVFIAWPALQNSQSDTARRQDVGRVVSALEQYKVDNQGDLSSLGAGYGQTYRPGVNTNIIGTLSQIKQVIIWSATNTSAYGTGQGTYLGLNTIGGNTSDPALGVIIGFTCAQLQASDTSNPSASVAAVWVPLHGGTNYCASV